jgi:hypothetical protein
MSRIPVFFVAFIGLALGAPTAAAPGPTPSDRPDEAAKSKEKLVCVRELYVGSRFPKKTCRTAAEWRAEREQTKRELDQRDRTDD